MISDDCQGCDTYKNGACSYKYMDKYGICPCAECLIKGVCHIACETFTNFQAQKEIP